MDFLPKGWAEMKFCTSEGKHMRVDTTKPWWDKGEAALYLDVSTRQVNRFVERGLLRAYRLGGRLRFKPADVEGCFHRLLDEKSAPATYNDPAMG